MKHFWAALFLLASISLAAQNTVTGTIIDPNGNVYANGTASAVSVPATGQAPIFTSPVPTNVNGSFSMSLASNTWMFTLCAPPTPIGPLGNATPKQICFTSPPIAISGSVDLSSQLNPLAAIIGPFSSVGLAAGGGNTGTLPIFQNPRLVGNSNESEANGYFNVGTTNGVLVNGQVNVGGVVGYKEVTGTSINGSNVLNNADAGTFVGNDGTWGCQFSAGLGSGLCSIKAFTLFGNGAESSSNPGLNVAFTKSGGGTASSNSAIFAYTNNSANAANLAQTDFSTLNIGQPQRTGNDTNGIGLGIFITNSGLTGGVLNNRFGWQNIGFYVSDMGNSNTNSGDWNIYSASGAPNSGNGRNYLQGNTYTNALYPSNAGVPIQASVTVNGSISTAALGTPTQTINIANIGAGGGTTYTYKITCVDSNSYESAATSGTTTATGNATLNSTNYNQLQMTNPVANPPVACMSYNIYRTVGGASQGKIGNVAPSNQSVNNIIWIFNDQGAAGDGGTPPTVSTGGGITTPAGALSNIAGNLFQVAADFTVAANTSLQTITGLSWTLPQPAAKWSFHCSGSYSIATANAAVAFGIQAATVAPTNIFAIGRMQTLATTGAEQTGILATLNTTTATNMISATPASAVGSLYVFDIDGTIEEPANDQGNVINIMVSTGNASDPVTVKRGSYCRF